MNEKDLNEKLDFIISNQAYLLLKIIQLENKISVTTKSASYSTCLSELKREYEKQKRNS